MIPLPESVARVVLAVAAAPVAALAIACVVSLLADHLSRRAKRLAKERR